MTTTAAELRELMDAIESMNAAAKLLLTHSPRVLSEILELIYKEYCHAELIDHKPKMQKKMQYYDLKKNWRKVKRAIECNPHIEETLVRDFNKYTFGRWNQEFKSGQYPREYESCDWDCHHRGREPAFWRYTKHAACHYLVNFNLELALVVEPKRTWRIITSDQHSTVWDGDSTLCDFNFFAMGIGADECFQLAHGKEQPPGKHIPLDYAEHYSVDLNRNKQDEVKEE